MARGDARKAMARTSTRGRPRTPGLEERVLAATRRVVIERGYVDATLDEIAAEAEVSKGSIYRRWPTKGVLVYDACLARPDELQAVIDTGDIRADLVAVAMLTAKAFRRKQQRELMAQVFADAARDPELMELLRTRFFAPRSDVIVRRVELAVERGELSPDINVALVPALLNGSQQYLWSIRQRTLTDDEVGDLVDMIIGAALLPR
jgi:AcrR family transcriptional regulator